MIRMQKLFGKVVVEVIPQPADHRLSLADIIMFRMTRHG